MWELGGHHHIRYTAILQDLGFNSHANTKTEKQGGMWDLVPVNLACLEEAMPHPPDMSVYHVLLSQFGEMRILGTLSKAILRRECLLAGGHRSA